MKKVTILILNILIIFFIFNYIVLPKIQNFKNVYNLKIEAENYCGKDCKLKYLTQSSYVCYNTSGGLIDERVFCNYYHFYDLESKKNIYVVASRDNNIKFYKYTLPEYILKEE